MKKKIFITIFIVLTLFLIGTFFRHFELNINFNLFPPNYAKINYLLEKDELILSQIIEELNMFHYKNITISSSDQFEFIHVQIIKSTGGTEYKKTPISSKKLKDDLQTLYEKGYIQVAVYNGYYEFTKWTSFGESRGIMFTLNKINLNKERIEGDQTIEFKKLSKSNWYYYKHTTDR